jgi:hypothetical protein
MDANGHENGDSFNREWTRKNEAGFVLLTAYRHRFWITLSFATVFAALPFAFFVRPGNSVAWYGGQASNADELVLFSCPFVSIRGS